MRQKSEIELRKWNEVDWRDMEHVNRISGLHDKNYISCLHIHKHQKGFFELESDPKHTIARPR